MSEPMISSTCNTTSVVLSSGFVESPGTDVAEAKARCMDAMEQAIREYRVVDWRRRPQWASDAVFGRTRRHKLTARMIVEADDRVEPAKP